MNKPDYYYQIDKGENFTVERMYEVCDPHLINSLAITRWDNGSMCASLWDEPFTGSKLSDIRLSARPSNFDKFKDFRQEVWNLYTELLNRQDHGNRFQARIDRNAQGAQPKAGRPDREVSGNPHTGTDAKGTAGIDGGISRKG